MISAGAQDINAIKKVAREHFRIPEEKVDAVRMEYLLQMIASQLHREYARVQREHQ